MTDFDLIIQNWVRWSRTRSGIKSVKSLEGRYRSRQPWDYVPTALPPVSKVAGEETESAWAKIPSIKHKLILKWDLIYARPPWAICKSLKVKGFNVHITAYESTLNQSLNLFRLSIDNQKKTAHNNANSCYHDFPAIFGGRGVREIDRAAA